MPAPATSACSTCGRRAPRADLFGVEPDLLCEPCARAVRERMFVRYRPLVRTHGQTGTLTLLAIVLPLFVATHLARHGALGDGAWLRALEPWFPIWEGEVWRHVTSLFVHVGVLHVVFNAMALWTLGRAVEYAFGPVAMGLVFLATGVVGSIAQWAMVTAPGVGMSGAIFGLGGFLIPLRTSHPVAAAVMDRRMINMLLTWLVLCVVLTEVGTLRIANWAHGGGLLWGLVLGAAVAHRRRRGLVPLAGLLTAGLLAASPWIALGEQQAVRTWHLWYRERVEPLLARDAALVERARALEARHGDDAGQAREDPEYARVRAEIDRVRAEIEALERTGPPLPPPLRRIQGPP